jgi:hypothetical protein
MKMSIFEMYSNGGAYTIKTQRIASLPQKKEAQSLAPPEYTLLKSLLFRPTRKPP